MMFSTFKKWSLLLIAANLFALAVNAQIQFGVKGGLNIAELLVKGEEVYVGGNPQILKNYPRKALNAGVFLYIPLPKHFSLQPEAVFSEQGANGKPSNEYLVSATEAYQYNYVNIPVLLKYSFNSGLFLETGPQLGLLISAEIAETVVGATATSYYNVNDRYKSVDVGWSLGCGYLSPVNLGIDIRYNLGLTNFGDASNGEGAQNAPVQTGTVKNSVVQIGLFYMFGKTHGPVEQ